VGGVKSSVSAIAIWFSYCYIVDVFTRIKTPGEASQPSQQSGQQIAVSQLLRLSEPKETFPGNPNYHIVEDK